MTEKEKKKNAKWDGKRKVLVQKENMVKMVINIWTRTITRMHLFVFLQQQQQGKRNEQ